MDHYVGQLLPIDPDNDSYICETCKVPAQYRLVTKLRLGGIDWTPYCSEHADLRLATMLGTCDWCKGTNLLVKPHRDFEEGSGGPLYDVCRACRIKESNDLSEETGWDV
jgi:hypothetical protein